MKKCFINQCVHHDIKEGNYCEKYLNVSICNNYVNNNCIQLKPIINEDFTDYHEFYNKLVEELDEFKTAIINLRATNLLPQYYQDFEDSIKENVIEEFHDVIQSMIQLLLFEDVSLMEIIEGQEKHFEKLESRGWKFNE